MCIHKTKNDYMKKLFFMFAVLLLFTVTTNSSARSTIAAVDKNKSDAGLLSHNFWIVVKSTTNTGTLFALKNLEVDNVSLIKILRASASNNGMLTLQSSLRTGNNSSIMPEGTVRNSDQVNMFDVENFTEKKRGFV